MTKYHRNYIYREYLQKNGVFALYDATHLSVVSQFLKLVVLSLYSASLWFRTNVFQKANSMSLVSTDVIHRGVTRVTLAIAFASCIATTTAQAGIDFGRDVQPIFEKHCFECHGPNKQESGYRLDEREIAMRGGDFGVAAIVPGDAKQSPLFRFVNGDEAESMMPPSESENPEAHRRAAENPSFMDR